MAAAGGLVLAGRFGRISGVCLAIAGLLFLLAARADVAATYAPAAMPKRTVRIVNLGLGAVAVLFFGIGVALVASLLHAS